MNWKIIKGAVEMTPLEMNDIALSSERHSSVEKELSADSVNNISSSTVHNPVRKTSLSSLAHLAMEKKNSL